MAHTIVGQTISLIIFFIFFLDLRKPVSFAWTGSERVTLALLQKPDEKSSSAPPYEACPKEVDPEVDTVRGRQREELQAARPGVSLYFQERCLTTRLPGDATDETQDPLRKEQGRAIRRLPDLG
jgi:hypothetical protein